MMGQKPPLKRNEIWAIRTRLQIADQTRNLALFNLAIDSKLRACDLVGLRVRDVTQGSNIASRAIVMQAMVKVDEWLSPPCSNLVKWQVCLVFLNYRYAPNRFVAVELAVRSKL
jgi:hypothetical protein